MCDVNTSASWHKLPHVLASRVLHQPCVGHCPEISLEVVNLIVDGAEVLCAAIGLDNFVSKILTVIYLRFHSVLLSGDPRFVLERFWRSRL